MPKKVATPKPSHKTIFAKIIEAFNAASAMEKGGVIYCPSRLGFNLGMLTEKEEAQFRELLKSTGNISVISVPIGKKKNRYKDLFKSGRTIHPIVGKNGKEILYVPTRTFQRVWCRDGAAPDYVTIIA